MGRMVGIFGNDWAAADPTGTAMAIAGAETGVGIKGAGVTVAGVTGAGVTVAVEAADLAAAGRPRLARAMG